MAPNKKKRTNKKKKAAPKKPDPPARAVQTQQDETAARLSLELEALGQQINTLLQNGANGGDERVLEMRNRSHEKFKELVMYQEELRWSRARQVFDEMYRLPLSEADEREYEEECPICNEAIPVRPVRHPCCGQVECQNCVKKFQDGELEKLHDWLLEHDEDYKELGVDGMTAKIREMMGANRDKTFQCIFCRQRTPANESEYREYIETAAQEGRAWAQEKLSDFLLKEGKTEEGFVWLRKAVAQEYAPAQLSMGTRLADQDKNESLRLMKIAAYKGDAIAQCVYGSQILEENEEEATILLTLSAVRGVCLAQAEIARKFGGMDDQREREVCIYWYEKAAQQGDARSQNQLALLLITQAERVFGSCGYPGYSPIPQAHRWNCRSRKAGLSDALQVAQLFKRMFFAECAVCRRSQQDCKKRFLACSRCESLPYCGKACQRQHWRDGHKYDCCDVNEPLPS